MALRSMNENAGVWVIVMVTSGAKLGDEVLFPAEGTVMKPDDTGIFVSWRGVVDKYDILPNQWGLVRLKSCEFRL